MAFTEGSETVMWSGPLKECRSPDWSLQLDSMKSESLVIAGQNTAVNTFPGLVHTARHTMGWDAKRVVSLTFGRTITTLCFMTGVKS